jgi:hypothetical protein
MSKGNEWQTPYTIRVESEPVNAPDAEVARTPSDTAMDRLFSSDEGKTTEEDGKREHVKKCAEFVPPKKTKLKCTPSDLNDKETKSRMRSINALGLEPANYRDDIHRKRWCERPSQHRGRYGEILHSRPF